MQRVHNRHTDPRKPYSYETIEVGMIEMTDFYCRRLSSYVNSDTVLLFYFQTRFSCASLSIFSVGPTKSTKCYEKWKVKSPPKLLCTPDTGGVWCVYMCTRSHWEIRDLGSRSWSFGTLTPVQETLNEKSKDDTHHF